MKLLWTKDLKMNTVHVRDVVRALWHLKDAGPPGEIYNLVDKGETSKGVTQISYYAVKERLSSQNLCNCISLSC